jgi:hypothetical protein
MYRLVLFFVVASFLAGCGTKLREGECIQNTLDGFVWRIVDVEWGKCTVQGWYDGKWGLLVSEQCGLFDHRRGYIKIQCPFSNKIIHESR